MKNLLKKLPVLAFVFAIFAAFAFAPVEENPDPNRPLFANTTAGWEEISHSTMYLCNGPTETCVAQFDTDDPDTGVIIYEEKGVFQEL